MSKKGWKGERYRHGLASKGVKSAPQRYGRYTVHLLHEVPKVPSGMSTVLFYPGQAYSENKDEIKKLLKEHKLKWVGSLMRPEWKGEEGTLTAAFVRDDEGVTQQATLTLTSESEGLTESLSELTRKFGGTVTQQGLSQEEYDRQMEKAFTEFEAQKHNMIENERRRGMPERWLNLMDEDLAAQQIEMFGERR